jgi:integral membrane sensor domain MASE1
MRPVLGRELVQKSTSARPRAFKIRSAPPINWAMTRISILGASLVSMLCMAALFVTVAIAAGPQTQPHGTARSHAEGLCFLHLSRRRSR